MAIVLAGGRGRRPFGPGGQATSSGTGDGGPTGFLARCELDIVPDGFYCPRPGPPEQLNVEIKKTELRVGRDSVGS